MWEAIQKLWEVIQDPDNREALSWLGGGAVVAAGGIWAVIKYFAERKKIVQIQKPLADQLDKKDSQIAALSDQIAALTKLLREKNPAAGPGAEQAVGAAVQSIAKGAAEGNSRLQQALDLLKANKIAEATHLLSAFAGDKMARIEKDRKEAAIAYRNLGAIARIADPKQALEAYGKAVALDPDDVDSLYWAGWIQIDYGNLNEAQTRLERVLTLAKTEDQAFYIYWALLGLGDIKQRRGDLAGALKFYNDGLSIAEGLGNAGWQRDLSVSFIKVGDVQMEQGDLAGALKSYNDSLAIMDRLAKSDLGNALWQRDLSVSFTKIGDVQKEQDDLAGALKSYSDSLAISHWLATSDPSNALWKRDLWVSRNKIGQVLVAQGDLAGALVSYQAGLDITEALAHRDPANTLWQRDLSISRNLIGDVQKAQGDLADALKSYNDGLAIAEQLVKSGPGNAEWQRDLRVSRNNVGEVLVAQGDLAGALESHQAGLDIAEALAHRDPDNAGWQRDLAVSFAYLASVYRAPGDRAKALDALRQGQAIMARLTKLSPDNAQWKQDFAEFDRLIAELAAR